MSVHLIAWAYDQEVGSPTEKAVLLALANRANHDTKECYPSVAAMAKETELGEATVRRALKALTDKDFIARERRRRADGSLGVYNYSFPHYRETARARTPALRASARPPAQSERAEPIEDLEPRGVHPSASPQEEPSVPSLTKIGGRDIAFDALALACGIEERSPRLKEVGFALNGHTRACPLGIREQFWTELGFLGIPGERFEEALAAAVPVRVAMYRQAFMDATLTPLALAKWWTDLPKMSRGSLEEFYDQAKQAEDDMRRRHAG